MLDHCEKKKKIALMSSRSRLLLSAKWETVNELQLQTLVHHSYSA